MQRRIRKTERFLRQKLAESSYFVKKPEAGIYRLEHSLRVARIAAEIARAEGMDEEAMTIAGLLHDVSYCREFENVEDWKNHGREAARIARPFLESLELAEGAVGDICYGIAIHTDDEADFPGERTAFAQTIGDADNIDRFDAYRLYETLESVNFSKLSLEEKRFHVENTAQRLEGYGRMALATPTATKLWQERIGFYLEFYHRLRKQLAASAGFVEVCGGQEAAELAMDDRMVELSGRF